MTRVGLALLIVAGVAGCSRDDAATADAGAATRAPTVSTTSASPVASGTTSASSAPAKAAPAGQARALSGPYQTTKGDLTLPEAGAFGAVSKWPGDTDPAGVGAGTLTLQIAADGRVSGKVAGALGDLTVDGFDRDGQLTAHLVPPAGAPITSFTGTLIAKDDGAKVTGTMRLSAGNNRLVRTADVTLAAGS